MCGIIRNEKNGVARTHRCYARLNSHAMLLCVLWSLLLNFSNPQQHDLLHSASFFLSRLVIMRGLCCYARVIPATKQRTTDGLRGIVIVVDVGVVLVLCTKITNVSTSSGFVDQTTEPTDRPTDCFKSDYSGEPLPTGFSLCLLVCYCESLIISHNVTLCGQYNLLI